MPKSLATLRAEESADCAYAVFIEGLPYIWVTDHTGDGLLGSGAGTWIGTYEAANTTWEDVGSRTVLPGLRIRGGPSRGDLDFKTGLFRTTNWTFEIIDYDGVVGALFANEGKGGDILGQRIAPGTSALGATITLRGGQTPDPADYNIGIERIGPSRERRWWWCLPEQGIGLHHQVHQESQGSYEGPPEIPVTTEPTIFAGRMVTLWRLYRDRNAVVPGLVFDPPMLQLDDPISGSAATLDGTTYSTTNKSRVFDGATDRVDYTTSPYDITDGDPVSVSMWVYCNDLSNQPRIWTTQQTAGSAGPFLDITSAGALRFYNANDVGTDLTRRSVDGTITTGQWYHVCVTYDGSNTQAGITLYVDGAETTYFGGSDGGATQRDGSFSWSLGGWRYGDAFCLDGEILSAKGYNRVLSAAEVADSANLSLGWVQWDDCFPAYAPEWIGVLKDSGEFDGADTWKISCHGTESLLRRTAGSYDVGWMDISGSAIALETWQRGIALSFEFWGEDSADNTTWESINFGNQTLSSAGSKTAFTTEINDIIQDVRNSPAVVDFGSINYQTSTLNGTTYMGTGDANHAPIASLDNDGITMRRPSDTGPVGSVAGAQAMRLCLHERVWRIIGFEPAIQANQTPETLKEAHFYRVDDDNKWSNNASANAPPQSGKYWVGVFSTHKLGEKISPYNADGDVSDNSGAPRNYWPLYDEAPVILPHTPIAADAAGDTTFTVSANFPYVEPDPTIDADQHDAARFFVFKGKRFVGDITPEGTVVDSEGASVDAESEDYAAVAEVRWNYLSSRYGTVEEPSGFTEFTIARWVDGRKFGLDTGVPTTEWAALAGDGEYGIKCRPLNCYAYAEYPDNANDYERASSVFTQVLASTGTTTGWGATYDIGDNNTGGTGATFWHNDITTSELGLGIPANLIQSPSDIYDAFASMPGGIDSPINRVRYCYAGSFSLWDTLTDLVRPRGLAMSLAGGQFGVVPMSLFDPADADFTITENDTYGSLTDPRDVHPSQKIRATGAIDKAVISYDLSPLDNSARGEYGAVARDPGARFRRGDLVEQMTGHGLRRNFWTGVYREIWSNMRAKFMAQRHFIVRTRLSRIQGQDIWPGARVLYSNRNVVSSTGARGVTNAQAIVISCKLGSAKDHAYDVELLVFDQQGDGVRVFMPIGKIDNGTAGYSGGTAVTLFPDAGFINHDNGEDGDKFVAASWMSGTAATVCILEDVRGTYTLHNGDTTTVSSASGTSVTLSGAFSTTFHLYSDKYLVMVGYASQVSGAWPQTHGLPIVLDDREFGTSTPGYRYVVG